MSDQTRIINYNWRGQGESSVFPNGQADDASLGNTTTEIDSPALTQAETYFTLGPGSGGSGNPKRWMGTFVANGQGTTGMLYRRNRYFDPNSGQFTQADPIGVAGGMNAFGLAGGDAVNFNDPFGLCRWGDIACLNDLVWAKVGGKGYLGAVGAQFVTNMFALFGASSVDANAKAAAGGSRFAFGLMAGEIAANALPGGGESVQGTKAAVRAGLRGLNGAPEVVRGIKGLLSSGKGEEWGVQLLEDGGAMVNRFVTGGDRSSSAIYTYILSRSGNVTNILQRAFDRFGNLTHFDVIK